MPYDAGQVVTVDGVEYTVGDPVDAYVCTDPEGNEVEMTATQLDAGAESEGEAPEAPTADQISKMTPAEFKAHKAAMAAK